SEAERQRIDRQRAFSIVEFSRVYGLGRTKVYEELKSGRLRGRKIGKRTIIAEDDAEDWLRRLPLITTEPVSCGELWVPGAPPVLIVPCPTCGATPCHNPTFCAACCAADRRAAQARR